MKYLVILLVVALSGCSGPLYKADMTRPKAGLRVASTLGGNTLFNSVSRDTCEVDVFLGGHLGFFHPWAGSMQSGRRGFDRRIGLPGGEIYDSNMQAESFINVDNGIRIFISNTTQTGVSVVGNNAYSLDYNSCEGFYDVDLIPNRNYEIVASSNENGCFFSTFELVEDGGSLKRNSVEMIPACLDSK